MRDLLLRLVGWRGAFLHGDPCVFDRYRWIRARIRSGPVRTLDAGAGNGAFSFLAAHLGNSAVGLSFSAAEMASASRRARALGLADRCQFVVADLRNLSEAATDLGEFDQVVCLEVAEHLRDDQKLFCDLAALLRPGGRLFVTVPYSGHRPLVREAISSSEDGGHVRWGYTHDQLTSLFTAAGLTPVDAGYVSGYLSQKLTNIMRLGEAVHPLLGWVLALPLRPLVVLDPPLTALFRHPYLSAAAVAVRDAPAYTVDLSGQGDQTR